MPPSSLDLLYVIFAAVCTRNHFFSVIPRSSLVEFIVQLRTINSTRQIKNPLVSMLPVVSCTKKCKTKIFYIGQCNCVVADLNQSVFSRIVP